MKRLWKRFAAWATGLQSNLFGWTRIKLTFLYVLIIVVTLGVYSTALYFALLNNVRHEVVGTLDQTIRHQIFENAMDHVQLQIFLIDLVTFVIAAIGSYWLAGVNLRPIKKALEAQEAFSSDASHELRTPLAVMKTDIEVLLRSKVEMSEEVKKILNSNLEEINKLTSMTSELLDLARGKEKNSTEIVISDIVKNEVSALHTLASQKKISLIVKGVSTNAMVADREAVGRVFKNIIANAISYTNEGNVTITMSDTRNVTTITVVDTGIGISAQNLSQIFKRFYKVDSSLNAAGSGLGLAIAKHIVEQCRGSIEIKSVLNQGTVVTIVLPSHKN